ncbi:MAG: outer membrane protein transport protein, partial [Parachlamydia sp.]|nr:outer membrane protein transport protein [Parachlamydia sp.]
LYAASTVLAYSWRCHHFGLSLDVLVGRHKASGAQNFDTPELTVSTNNVTNRGYDWNWGLGVRIGWLWEVTSTFRLGVYYSPETKMSRFHKYEGFIPERGIVHNAQRMNSGFSWRFVPCATVAFDAEYIWISRLRGAANPIVKNPVATKLGSKNGSAFGLKSELILRGGIDYALTECLIVRLGYIYAKEIQRSSQAFLDVIWNRPIVNFITTGLTYQWNSCVGIDMYYVHGFEKHITGIGAIPAFLGGGNIKMKRRLDTVGVGIGIKY